jgi:anti-anti-sigma factor
MHISRSDSNGITVFTLEGRVDSMGASEMDEMLQTTVSNGHYKIILDMTHVTYINSAGLRSLADILTQSRAQKGDLRLVALSPKVERVFKIIGFDKFFETYDSLEKAKAGL